MGFAEIVQASPGLVREGRVLEGEAVTVEAFEPGERVKVAGTGSLTQSMLGSPSWA